MNPNLAFEGQGTAALVKLGRLQKVNKTNPNLTRKGSTGPRSLMATEEASLIEAVTSGTAFQPRNNEDFNQLGLIRLKIEAEKITRCATNKCKILGLNFETFAIVKAEEQFLY